MLFTIVRSCHSPVSLIDGCCALSTPFSVQKNEQESVQVSVDAPDCGTAVNAFDVPALKAAIRQNALALHIVPVDIIVHVSCALVPGGANAIIGMDSTQVPELTVDVTIVTDNPDNATAVRGVHYVSGCGCGCHSYLCICNSPVCEHSCCGTRGCCSRVTLPSLLRYLWICVNAAGNCWRRNVRLNRHDRHGWLLVQRGYQLTGRCRCRYVFAKSVTHQSTLSGTNILHCTTALCCHRNVQVATLHAWTVSTPASRAVSLARPVVRW